MLAFTHMVNFFSDEFSCLGAGRLALFSVALGSLSHFLFRHVSAFFLFFLL